MAQDEKNGNGLSDDDIVSEIAKMMDAERADADARRNETPAEAFARLTKPETVANVLHGKPLAGFVIILTDAPGSSVIAYNNGKTLPDDVRAALLSELVCGLETAKVRILQRVV